MNNQSIKTESILWVNFKRTMYALMVIVIALAIPLLSYLELSKVDSNNQKENTIKVQILASALVKANTVKI